MQAGLAMRVETPGTRHLERDGDRHERRHRRDADEPKNRRHDRDEATDRQARILGPWHDFVIAQKLINYQRWVSPAH